jgi:hypothetical protein
VLCILGDGVQHHFQQYFSHILAISFIGGETGEKDDRLKITKMFIHNFRSSQSYVHRGEDRWIYLCMKMTKVSENLHYFYLLAGKLYFMNEC